MTRNRRVGGARQLGVVGRVRARHERGGSRTVGWDALGGPDRGRSYDFAEIDSIHAQPVGWNALAVAAPTDAVTLEGGRRSGSLLVIATNTMHIVAPARYRHADRQVPLLHIADSATRRRGARLGSTAVALLGSRILKRWSCRSTVTGADAGIEPRP